MLRQLPYHYKTVSYGPALYSERSEVLIRLNWDFGGGGGHGGPWTLLD